MIRFSFPAARLSAALSCKSLSGTRALSAGSGCSPCRNGSRQCRLPDIDRQTPAGLPCPESESLVAGGGELHCHSLGRLPRPAQCWTAAFFLHLIHILCHMFFLFRPYFFHFSFQNLRPAGVDLPSLQPPGAGEQGFSGIRKHTLAITLQ